MFHPTMGNLLMEIVTKYPISLKDPGALQLCDGFVPARHLRGNGTVTLNS
jgi:hypothetical protein